MLHSESFGLAAEVFIGLVARIPSYQWNDPGLGEWTVRGLVGHTSRAILTIENYLGAEPAPAVTVPDAETYYLRAFDGFTDNDAIAARGVEAGESLGADPMPRLTASLVRASALLAVQDPARIVAVGSMGIPVDEYLRTRVFELVVHSIDISRATDLPHGMPARLLADCAGLAARVAAFKGEGEDVLFALTGRAALPPGFSIF
ncbi:maleylpyruvate isomerase family mycothiol-dependent enzyme [Galbitalea soli]|uniref:Maleylpyruvate isomerase family protein n=1 Tax=Galbitalea soli TaxID=1268042 RepID=A0A7C9TRW9_9MICO|nr:maleylpyruvate isomerase family protein [Galbitalea soli]NYJ29262.1 uncharacterized protein (TIGR03083 family) [Galbitalea soli]